MATNGLSQPDPGDDPLPRPARKRRRAKEDRGLPPDSELKNLARTYLETQRRLWLDLLRAGLLPEPTDAVIDEMVADFKARHRTGVVDVAAVLPFTKLGFNLGGNYDRYSADNSNPSSILDQMVNSLRKARDEKRFVSWSYVFADYSVSGMDRSRQGYRSFKAVLADAEHFIESTYVDDFTRPSRDDLEWWKLAAVSKRLGKRMIGASDGFDLSSPDWDLKITVYGLLSRLFLKGVREKVRRGMCGAARRGTVLGKLGLGFTRRVLRDAAGNIVYRPNGRPRHVPCIDPETQKYRQLLYEMFVIQNLSLYCIRERFNEMKVDGWDGWTPSALRKLLWSGSSIGVFIWNKTRREFNPETEKVEIIANPHSEWERYFDRSLAIVPLELWKSARKKFAAMRRKNPRTGKKQSRNQVSATTLFSGTLYCECGAEIKLLRSTEKYKQMGCVDGAAHARGCKLSSSKSVKVIEECLLKYIRDKLFTNTMLEECVAKANSMLDEERNRPQVDVSPFKAAVGKKEASIRRLVKKVAETDNEDLSQGYHREILRLQAEVNELKGKIHAATISGPKSVKPLTVTKAKEYLATSRETLNQNIPVAAEAVRTLTGPIQIRQEPILGKKRGARWIATFSADLMRLLGLFGNEEFRRAIKVLGQRSVTEVSVVVIDKVPAYEKQAIIFKEMADKGASVQSIATAHKLSLKYAGEILRFGTTGERPNWGHSQKAETWPATTA